MKGENSGRRPQWTLDVFQLLGALAAIGAGTAQPLMAIIIGGLANEFNRPTDRSILRKEIDSEVLYFVYIFLGQWCLTCLYGILLSISAMKHSRSLRRKYLNSAIRQEMGLIPQGKAIDNLATSISTIEDALAEKLGIVMQAGSTVIVSLIIAFVHGWQLSLALSSTIVLLFISNFGTAALDTRAELEIQTRDEKAATLAEECLSAIRLVRSCVAESKLGAKYTALLEKSRTKRFRKSPILGLQFSISYFGLLCSYGLAFWYGTILLNEVKINSGGTIVIIIMSINQGTNGMRKVLPFYGLLSKARVASNTLNGIILAKPNLDPLNPSGISIECMEGNIRLQNVSFVYSARSASKVLSNLSLSFEAGKTTALVGASGSGKSTIVGLLERWHDPSEGRISIDGYDIKDLNVKFLRSHIGLVQQDVVLFNDTIFYNVACGLYGTPLEAIPDKDKLILVVQSCTNVGAHSFIESLPEGYNTKVGDKGSQLSGGQRQRIGIARAIISSPKILVFDEATSALDVESERVVENAIREVATERTTIIISHKLSFIQQADKIVLLKNGTVVEEGTHQSLAALNGTYSRFLEAQELQTTKQEVTKASLDVERFAGKETTSSIERTSPPTKDIDGGHDENDIPKEMSLIRCLLSVITVNKASKRLLVALVPVSVLAGAIYPVQAIVFGNSVSGFGNVRDIQHHENFWALMWLAAAVGTFFAFLLMGIISSLMSTITKFHFQTGYFNAMLRQALKYFDHKSYLSASLSLHTNQIHNLVNILGFLVVAFVSIISCSILALAAEWRLALVGLFGSLPVIVFAGYLRIRTGDRKSKTLSEPLLSSAQYAAEVIGAVRTVASLTMEAEVCQKLEKKMAEGLPLFYRNIFTTMPLFAISESGNFLGLALIFWYGGTLLTEAKITATQLWIIYLAVLACGQSAGEVFANSSYLFQARNAINTILNMMTKASEGEQGQTEPGQLDETNLIPLGPISFRNVNFSYLNAPNCRVLEDINISIDQGQKVAIVGPSGSGKSTIIALLEKFYDVDSGSIFIGPDPLNKLSTTTYRKSVSLVSQDTVLFQGTMSENIMLGVSDTTTNKQLEAAAKDANIHDFIMSLPEGYNTQCGTKGMELSGGQRQRIAIARALIRRPAILLLDEATSALDSLSEIEVLEALKRVHKETTTITVAHKLATVRDADLILVLVKGRIIERGSHTQLLQKKGTYWTMCQAQALDREL